MEQCSALSGSRSRADPPRAADCTPMSPRVVVGAVIVRGGRVLGARRSAPTEEAGWWEFPGGKVEAGESDAVALTRECSEELGVSVTVGELVGAAPIAPGVELRLYRATLMSGEPRPLQDHDELRWLRAAELAPIAWLPGDRPILGAIAALLGDGSDGSDGSDGGAGAK